MNQHRIQQSLTWQPSSGQLRSPSRRVPRPHWPHRGALKAENLNDGLGPATRFPSLVARAVPTIKVKTLQRGPRSKLELKKARTKDKHPARSRFTTRLYSSSFSGTGLGIWQESAEFASKVSCRNSQNSLQGAPRAREAAPTVLGPPFPRTEPATGARLFRLIPRLH